MSGTWDENVFMARLSEQAERYEDMAVYMTRVACMGSELSCDERNLLSIAYKNSVGSRRQAWRAVHSLEQEKRSQGPEILEVIKGYRQTIETELNGKCMEIIEVLANQLIPRASDNEAKVFYQKMKGDYFRYLAEFVSGPERDSCAQQACDSYQAAWEIAVAALPPAHPVRLGLALNFSVFYFEVFASREKACMLAKSAFDEAMQVMDGLDDNQKADCEQIMVLLRDNLTLWTSDGQAAGDDKPPEQDGTAVEEL